MEHDQDGLGATCHRALEEWGLVERQAVEVQRTQGWERAQAVALLGRMRQARAVALLRELLHDPSREVCAAAVRGLGLQASPEAAQPLLDSFAEMCSRIPVALLQQALVSCCRLKPEVLQPYLTRAEAGEQGILMEVVAQVATPALLPALESLVESPDPQVRAQVARALGRLSEPAAVPLLGRLANDPVGLVRARAVQALDQVKGWTSVELILSVLGSEYADLRMVGAERLAQSLGRQAVSLAELLPAARERLRAQGWAMLLCALGQAGSAHAVDSGALDELLSQPVPAVRAIAGEWLSVAVATGADKVLLDTLLGSQPSHTDAVHHEGSPGAVVEFLGRYGDAALLAELEELAQRLPVGSPHQQAVARVRGAIRARLYV
jgi:HEAT repeat protein